MSLPTTGTVCLCGLRGCHDADGRVCHHILCRTVTESPTASTTHIVVPDASAETVQKVTPLAQQAPQANVVRSQWLLDCHAAQKRVDDAPFAL